MGDDDDQVSPEIMAAVSLGTFGAFLELVEALAATGALSDAHLRAVHDRLVAPMDMDASRDDPSMGLLREAADMSFAKSRKVASQIESRR